MFERFTDSARHVMVLAQEIAKTNGDNFIAHDHFLVALCDDSVHKSVAALALASVWTTKGSATSWLLAGQHQPPLVHIPFTPRVKQILTEALRAALNQGHNYVAPEHLLAGWIRVAAQRTEVAS